MLRICLCMLLGGYALSFCRHLPSDPALLVTSLVTATCLWSRSLRLPGYILLGFLLVWIATRSMLADRIPPHLQNEAMSITVRILDFPEVRSNVVRFVAAPLGQAELPDKIRLSWYEAPVTPQIGETWRVKVKLKRPRGLANPIGFDYELWLAKEGIGAVGYVVRDVLNGKLEVAAFDSFDRRSGLRRYLADRILALAGDNNATAVLLAVAVGARHRITREQWERYAVSGTSHLMAISGLHIGLAATGSWFLGRALIALVWQRVNARILAVPGAMIVVILYAEISGFAIPARRAMLMALFVSIALLFRRPFKADRILAVACLAVFVSDPLAIHAPGFKLSFAAVAVLLWRARQRQFVEGAAAPLGGRATAAVHDLAALQLVLLFGLFPLTSLIFGRVSWLAPAANLLVVPLFNLLTVPSLLLGLALDGVFASLGDRLIMVAWHSVRAILWLVASIADWAPATRYTATATGATLLVFLLPSLWAVAPPGFPGRRLAWVAAVAALLHKVPLPPPGCADLIVLEVGQGLASILRSGPRVLVFDTGPSFRGGSDSAELVLVPWLRAAGIEHVDLLVISHSDDDHAGGAASLLRAVEVSQISSGEPLDWIPRSQLACRSGQTWLWNGIRFAFMHPGRYPLQSDNNASCVLEVAAGAHKILFTGDIESPVENHLARESILSPVDIVIVPHHGSRTSSRPAFVSALRPKVAIVSAGFQNRWGFPKDDVVARWQQSGARVMNTSTSGAIHYRVCADSGIHLVSEHRMRHRKYWHDATEH